jgi:large conductance mechanosensitive channel
MKTWDEFKKFAFKGNVIDMAVGVIIGGAFGKIVTSFVNDIIMPPIGVLIGGVNFSDLKITMVEATGDTPAATINYGAFIQTILDFFIIALCIFILVKIVTKSRNVLEAKLKAQEPPKPAPEPPKPTKEEELLTEIRDLLKEKK